MRKELLHKWVDKILNTEEFTQHCMRGQSGLLDPIGILMDLFIESHKPRYNWEGSLPFDNTIGREFDHYYPNFRTWCFGDYDPDEVTSFFVDLIQLSDSHLQPTNIEIARFIKDNVP